MSIELDSAGALAGVARPVSPRSRAVRVDPGFQASLDRLLDLPDEASDEAPVDVLARSQPVTLSRHAKGRLASRGIELGPSEMDQLKDAVDTLDERGAKKALVVTGQQAWIVGVPKRTVITVMSREEALGQVFTDLDATYLAR